MVFLIAFILIVVLGILLMIDYLLFKDILLMSFLVVGIYTNAYIIVMLFLSL